MNAIKSVTFHPLVRPLRTTFSTALGKKQHLHNVVIRVTLEDGSAGTGEVPTSFAFKHETIELIIMVLKEAARRLKGRSIEDYPLLIGQFRRDFSHAVMAVSGLDVALFRASLSANQTSERSHWGGALHRIETDITIPFTTDRAALSRWVNHVTRKGFNTYKLKVSGNPGHDREAVSSVYAMLSAKRPGFTLRLDGNQGYTDRAFLEFLDYLQKRDYRIELFEQPLRKDDLKGFEVIRKYSHIPIILDETAISLTDARRTIEHGLGDGINIKLAKSGINESARIADLARQNGMKLMIGCMTETMVGLSAAVSFAAGTGLFDYVDLDSIYFLYGKNEYPGIRREDPAFVMNWE